MATAVIGQPATIQVGSDSYSTTVTYVSESGKLVRVARNSGMESTFTLRKNGRFVLKGLEISAKYCLAIGVAIDRLDPSF